MPSNLAINGGPQAVRSDPGDMFRWPIITNEDEEAMLPELRAGNMSGVNVTLEFEEEVTSWFGVDYALATNTDSAALHSAMFACGVGVGDEVICPSVSHWRSALPALNLGATVVFAEIDPVTLTIDPEDIERKITDKTRAIVAVHYGGHPADMDPIMEVANARGVKVIEDLSYAHGGLYKGRMLGTIGHVGSMSLESNKALAAGEGGLLLTNDQKIHERAVVLGHFERSGRDADQIHDPDMLRFAGVGLGGFKYRMHQLSSAVGRVQLKHYRERMEEIQKAMNHFWDLLDEVPGLKAHRPPEGSGSTMGGWNSPVAIYVPEELNGLSIGKFCEAVRAEGVETSPVGGSTDPLLHLHPVLNDADVYGHGKPTRLAHTDNDVRQPEGSLPTSEALPERVFSIPWFTRYQPKLIEEYAEAFRKVAANANELDQ